MKKHAPFLIIFKHNGMQLNMRIEPVGGDNTKPDGFKIIVNRENYGIIYQIGDHWESDDMEDQSMAELIGTCIQKIYKKVNKIPQQVTPAKFSLN
jgi:hypothetical protein